MPTETPETNAGTNSGTETNKLSTAPAQLEVTVQIDDLHSDWKRISHLANYFAEYIAYDFPQRERAENLLSTITNEILEAIVHLAPAQTTLQLRCTHQDETLMMDVTHQVKAELRPDYLLFVKKLGEEDGEQGYLQMLTADVKPEAYFNQLGLMILEYDFDVHLSLNIEQEELEQDKTVQENKMPMGQEINHFRTHVAVPDEVLSK
jgi:hypothetical protein